MQTSWSQLQTTKATLFLQETVHLVEETQTIEFIDQLSLLRG